jgi:hypothetical protein
MDLIDKYLGEVYRERKIPLGYKKKSPGSFSDRRKFSASQGMKGQEDIPTSSGFRCELCGKQMKRKDFLEYHRCKECR